MNTRTDLTKGKIQSGDVSRLLSGGIGPCFMAKHEVITEAYTWVRAEEMDRRERGPSGDGEP